VTSEQPPRRVRVTSPRRGATRRRPVAVAREIDAQTGVGEVFVRSLVSTHVVGVPLPWLLLGGLVYPALVALGWFYVRQAERVEREFSDLVERS
jgi:hypothetical protein